MIISLLILLPLAGSVITCLIGRKNEDKRDTFYLCEIVTVFLLAAALLALNLYGRAIELNVPGICGFGLTFFVDGFRAVYVFITAFMWLMTTLLSKQYFAHYRNRTRYYMFNQLTLAGTLGLFMSDDLYTTFIFFEIMSLCSYPWVAHDETPDAMSAARLYLAISVFGGMVTLMGLFMAYREAGSLAFSVLAQTRGSVRMTISACLILVGFSAKAGLFPLYMWLPKAHPVAPAPASALLSGVLTKTGVFGMMVVSFRMMFASRPFGNMLLGLGLLTMLLGAVLALLSTNLKRILACSSMSQIGYITVGIAMAVLLGEEGHVPVSGAIMHMVNHSMLKLTLFMAAGVIYMNLHKLELNDLRGFGRGKPLLHAAFLLGGCGLAGVPLFNGYLGKTLIHEGILEYAHELGGFSIYNVCEKIFLFAAGITTAYMLKIYIALFWQKNKPKQQKNYDALNHVYMTGRSAVALTVSMIVIPVLGCMPSILEKVSRMSGNFTGIGGVQSIAFFSMENLKGGGTSLLIGTLIYLFVVRRLLYDGKQGYIAVEIKIDIASTFVWKAVLRFVDSLCRAVDHAVENDFLLRDVPKMASRLFGAMDKAVENRLILKWIPDIVTLITRIANGFIDLAACVLQRTLFDHRMKDLYPHKPVSRFFVMTFGHLLNGITFLLNITFRRRHPVHLDFTYVMMMRSYEDDPEIERAMRTVSFGLLLFAGGLLFALIYLVFM